MTILWLLYVVFNKQEIPDMRGYMETLGVRGVTESVVQYLRIHIIEGELVPGQKLNEIELAVRLGINHTPLREAFRILENAHLIVSIPRKGCYVTVRYQ